MTLKQIYQKVKDAGTVPAYFAVKGQGDNTFFYGQRGHLEINNEEPFLVFVAEGEANQDYLYWVGKAADIHAPSIGHYSW